MTLIKRSFLLPLRERLSEATGFASKAWELFFEELWNRVSPLGVERYFPLPNNQSVAAPIVDLQFSKSKVSCAFIEFLIQRVTTGSGATELIEAGHLIAVYKPASEDWDLVPVDVDNPNDSGVDFTIDDTGQMMCETSNISGDPLISRLVVRVSTLAAKSQIYSRMGDS